MCEIVCVVLHICEIVGVVHLYFDNSFMGQVTGGHLWVEEWSNQVISKILVVVYLHIGQDNIMPDYTRLHWITADTIAGHNNRYCRRLVTTLRLLDTTIVRVSSSPGFTTFSLKCIIVRHFSTTNGTFHILFRIETLHLKGCENVLALLFSQNVPLSETYIE